MKEKGDTLAVIWKIGVRQKNSDLLLVIDRAFQDQNIVICLNTSY